MSAERRGHFYPCMVVVFKGHTVVFFFFSDAVCQVFSDGEVPGHY